MSFMCNNHVPLYVRPRYLLLIIFNYVNYRYMISFYTSHINSQMATL